MKRVYVNEDWCLGCHLCEYNCAFANSGVSDMAKALKNKPIFPRIRVEEDGKISYAVSCRHCEDPICVRSCISGALSVKNGAVSQNGDGVVQKCELCLQNSFGAPACVQGCPNRAIVYEERGEAE